MSGFEWLVYEQAGEMPMEVGSATPIAYDTCTSHFEASPAATMFLAT